MNYETGDWKMDYAIKQDLVEFNKARARRRRIRRMIGIAWKILKYALIIYALGFLFWLMLSAACISQNPKNCGTDLMSKIYKPIIERIK